MGAMVRSALFPTLRGDLDDQLEYDGDDDVDDDEFARLDEEGEEDDAVLSLLATFDVPELGHAYDMMRIEELYQLIARRGDAFAPSIDDDEDDDWVIIQDDDPRMDAVFAVA